MPVLNAILTAPLELAGLAAEPGTVLFCAADAVSGYLDIRSQASVTAARRPQTANSSQHGGRPHMAARVGQLVAGEHGSALSRTPSQQRLANMLLGPRLTEQRTRDLQRRSESGLGRAVASVVLSASASGQPAGYTVHPAALDASTHTAAALAGGKGANL